jgi:LPXTG-motif cell wall-anchored protein
MSDAASDALSALREHAPSLPSVDDAKSVAKDAASAVLSHVPSVKDVDVSALTDKLPEVPTGKKRSFAAVLVGLLALGGAAFAVLRRRSAQPAPVSPSIYTPPLPKP